MRISRRTLIAAAGAGALASAVPWSAAAAAPGDFANLRQRVRDVLTGGDFDPNHPMIARYVADLNAWADTLAAKIVRGAGRDRVFEDLPFDIANMRTTYDRLRDLALTYTTPGLARHGDPATEADILAGLRTTHDRIYHAGAGTPGNWWFWEIGAPRPLLWTCVLMGDALPAADRTATWRDIDSGTAPGTTDPVTRRYLTLSVEHGVEPRDAEYAYFLLPGASARHTARVAADPGVEVVANSSAVQAIRTPDRVMAAFFGAGSAAGLTVDAPVAVIVVRSGRTLTVSVADPTRAPTPIRITIDRATRSVLRRDPELVVATGQTTNMTATLSGGVSRSASFLLA